VIAFATPAWLAALAALAVPLAIHLWSHRARRPIRVGSLRLLSGVPPAAARALQLRDPWLLALRLAMLAALALSLADPYWAPRAPRPVTWALLSEEALNNRELIDSLRDAGAELRLLEAGITLLSDGSGQVADGSAQSAPGPLPSAICHPRSVCHLPHYWSLLSEADRLAPPGTRFVVAAPLVADRFRGTRPAIAAAVTWRDVRVDGPPVLPPAAAPPRRVVILADAWRRDDARYLEAAIRAAAQATDIPARVGRGSPADAAALTPEADWIVWLASDEAPRAVRERVRAGAVLFTLVGRDTLATRPTVVRFAAADAGTPLSRRAPFDGRGTAVWSDAAGIPLLTVERDERGFAYRLYARITPDLALAPGFAEAVTALWTGPAPREVAGAPRIAIAQALPARASAPARRAGRPAGALPLAVPLWVLAALALALDRGLAWRRGRRAS
jgi:hypothetical protein